MPHLVQPWLSPVMRNRSRLTAVARLDRAERLVPRRNRAAVANRDDEVVRGPTNPMPFSTLVSESIAGNDPPICTASLIYEGSIVLVRERDAAHAYSPLALALKRLCPIRVMRQWNRAAIRHLSAEHRNLLERGHLPASIPRAEVVRER